MALERMLGVDQTLLQGGDRAHVAAKGDDLSMPARTHGGIEHRKLDAGFGQVHDLPPFRRIDGIGLAQHGLDLGPAFRADRFGPRPAKPILAPNRQTAITAQRDIPNDALLVDHQGDIGRRCDKGYRSLGIETFKDDFRVAQLFHNISSKE